MNMDITSKSAYKLLQQLESDPQLQSVEDTSILNDEQYPTSFESAITNLKDIIPLISAVTILRWNESKDSKNLTQDQLQRMRTQRLKTVRNLILNPTVDNPWDKIKFNFWKDRVTNICLGAAQAAFQSHEDTSTLKFLFAASDKSNTNVHRADQRNVQGLMLFHPVLLQAPWEISATIDKDIQKLLEEKAPLIMARANPTITGAPTAHEMQLQMTAKQSVDSMTSALKLLLARIQKFTSHTFHVFIRDLVPGARAGRSLLFTRIVEHRNQYLAKNRSTPTSKPYSALDTLTFIQNHFVQENENAVHISWTTILLHTRELLQPLYQWQASFDPLTRKYEQAKTKDLTKTEYRKLKCLITKQITDDEKVILAGIDSTFTIENIDKGNFRLRDFQDKLAANASRFQSKKYTPDSRILTYLKVRAQEFNVPVPSFMKKRLPEKGKGSQQSKRGRSHLQQSRAKSHHAYLQQPSLPSSTSVPNTTSTAPTFMSSKGKGKGKGAPKGQRLDSSHGKGKFFQKGASFYKGKGSSKGKPHKGSPKGNRTSSVSTANTGLKCDFCHMHGHISQNCRKRQALHNSTSYQQARSQLDTRQQLLIDQLENSLFAPNVCSWCLQGACTQATCYPPEEPDFYAEVTHFFQESLLPFVQNAKLCLPVDNSVPLMPQHFAFDGTDWGQYTEHEELAENQEHFDQEGFDQLMCEESSAEFSSYPLDDMLNDPQGEHSEYEVVHSEMHLLQDEMDEDMVHKDSIENINDSYYVDNFEDNVE